MLAAKVWNFEEFEEQPVVVVIKVKFVSQHCIDEEVVKNDEAGDLV